METVAEVGAGLQHTWQICRTCIEPSTRDDPDAGLVSEQEVEGLRTIWGMLDHDLCHAGELSPMLGALGLETPEF